MLLNFDEIQQYVNELKSLLDITIFLFAHLIEYRIYHLTTFDISAHSSSQIYKYAL